ncbi:MAG: hypothetical protein ACK53L_03455, partial [Pirellulaceae bacterium]
ADKPALQQGCLSAPLLPSPQAPIDESWARQRDFADAESRPVLETGHSRLPGSGSEAPFGWPVTGNGASGET